MIRPILFNGEMVRAILDGKKTQTRRIVKPQPPVDCNIWSGWIIDSTSKKEIGCASWTDTPGILINKQHIVKCPYGNVGDRLWVRESLRHFRRLKFLESKFFNPDFQEVPKEYQKWTTQYIATGTAVPYKYGAKEGWCGIALWQWKNKACPSIHMPKWASRITLEITNVSVDKVQNIPDENENSWNFDYGKTEYCWNNNPWVWMIDFKVFEKL